MSSQPSSPPAYDSIQALLDAHAAAGGAAISGVVRAVIASRETKPMRGSKTYEALTLHDHSAVVEVKDFRGVSAGGSEACVQVALDMEVYNDRVSPILTSLVDLPELEPLSLLMASPEGNLRQRERVVDTVRRMDVERPYRHIVAAAMRQSFEHLSLWPAATRHHHNYVGGLIDHTLEVLDFATAIAEMDSDPWDRELLVAACLLHDLGKIDEYAPPPALERSTGGELAYHLAYGAMRVGMAAQAARAAGHEIPDHVLHLLVHCIEQSHGEFRLDRTREALCKEARCLAAADLHSARRAVSPRERKLAARLRELSSHPQDPTSGDLVSATGNSW